MAKVRVCMVLEEENRDVLNDAAWILNVNKSYLVNKYLKEGLERDKKEINNARKMITKAAK